MNINIPISAMRIRSNVLDVPLTALHMGESEPRVLNIHGCDVPFPLIEQASLSNLRHQREPRT